MNLVSEVFNAIADRLASRIDDIAGFIQTGYSFEEWLNCEAFTACRLRPDWNVSPKPAYSKLGIPDSRELGDLLVSHGEERVVVEIGLIHGGTVMDKWTAKLDNDSTKLTANLESAVPLQIIVLASKVAIESSDYWNRHLPKVMCWAVATDLFRACAMQSHGELLIRGWTARQT